MRESFEGEIKKICSDLFETESKYISREHLVKSIFETAAKCKSSPISFVKESTIVTHLRNLIKTGEITEIYNKEHNYWEYKIKCEIDPYLEIFSRINACQIYSDSIFLGLETDNAGFIAEMLNLKNENNYFYFEEIRKNIIKCNFFYSGNCNDKVYKELEIIEFIKSLGINL